MKILALEPYYGGSHKAFLDGWISRSRHDWKVIGLRAYKWKWRMRHSAITFSNIVNDWVKKGQKWDAVFCSDMLNLAEFKGLCDHGISGIRTVLYFHENQLTYPVRAESERDYQFAMTNITSALAADAVWFNTDYHLNEFQLAVNKFLKRMPDYQPTDVLNLIRTKSQIHPPGIEHAPGKIGPRKHGPMRILWSARWEHDKNPEDFFEALKILQQKGVNFRLSVVGENFRDRPAVFDRAKVLFRDKIDVWGYQQDRIDYEKALSDADVVVSTADHEFFGIGVLEAAGAGCYPILPRRLSYPEIFGSAENVNEFFYDGTVEALAEKLRETAEKIRMNVLWSGDDRRVLKVAEKYLYNRLAGNMDDAIEEQVTKKGKNK